MIPFSMTHKLNPLSYISRFQRQTLQSRSLSATAELIVLIYSHRSLHSAYFPYLFVYSNPGKTWEDFCNFFTLTYQVVYWSRRGRVTDGQTNWQTDRQTDRQTEVQTPGNSRADRLHVLRNLGQYY